MAAIARISCKPLRIILRFKENALPYGSEPTVRKLTTKET